MDNSWQAAFLIFLGLLCMTVYGKVEQSEDGQSGKISFSTPDLNDEEAHSPWMPDMLKCDACRVVALQLHKTFDEFNKVHRAYKYKLPESEVLDLTEALCTNVKTFENYGLKQVNKVNRLSGPGLDTADVPGVLAGGGKWPGRLMDMCEQYMGEIGEMEIYNAYAKNPKSLKQFEDNMCRGKGILSECRKVEENMKKDEL